MADFVEKLCLNEWTSQVLDRDSNDNSILYKFAHSSRQRAIVAAEFSRFERARIFEVSFSTPSAVDCPCRVGDGWASLRQAVVEPL